MTLSPDPGGVFDRLLALARRGHTVAVFIPPYDSAEDAGQRWRDAGVEVVNISLHTIKVQNSDKTFSVIPTFKIVDVAYKNWRGMRESGGRRIQRSLLVDMNTIRFCDEELLGRLQKIDLISDYLQERVANGSQFMLPTEDAIVVADQLARRWGLRRIVAEVDDAVKQVPGYGCG